MQSSLQICFFQSDFLSSNLGTFIEACLLQRAKMLPSKWILHHDVAHFETECCIKLLLPVVIHAHCTCFILVSVVLVFPKLKKKKSILEIALF
jgi:hypothetical protein